MARKKKASKASKRGAKRGKQTTSARRATTRATAKKKTAVKRTVGGTSVDSLLKRFAQQRKSKESELANLIKKKTEVEEKTRKYREQIAKLAEQEKRARDEIAELDLKRDREVGELLARLGVQLSHSGRQPQRADDAAAGKSAGLVNRAGRDRARQPLSNARDETS